MMARMRGVCVALVCALGACGSEVVRLKPEGTAPAARLPGMAGGGCRVDATQTSVYVTEWSASEKANLEAMMAGEVGVAVEFTGCEMRLVPECSFGGEYVWRRTTPARDTLEIRSEDELHAKLPLGAAALSGELRRSGTLLVETTVAGQRLLDGADPVPDNGACKRATHIVNSVALGAFALRGTNDASGAGRVSVAGVDGGGQVQERGRTVRSAGAPEQCAAATEAGPSAECGSPLQVFLSPIPGRTEPAPPPGKVKADFVSGDAEIRWDVYLSNEAACTTPCTQWVDPEHPILIKEHKSEGFFEGKAEKLQVGRLGGDAAHVRVSAHKKRSGRLVGGILFTTFGGIAALAGGALSFAACGADEGDKFEGGCAPSIITGAAGLAGVGIGVWMIVRSGPRTEIRPITTAGRVSIDAIGPGFVAGSF